MTAIFTYTTQLLNSNKTAGGWKHILFKSAKDSELLTFSWVPKCINVAVYAQTRLTFHEWTQWAWLWLPTEIPISEVNMFYEPWWMLNGRHLRIKGRIKFLCQMFCLMSFGKCSSHSQSMLFCSTRMHCSYRVIILGKKEVLDPE